MIPAEFDYTAPETLDDALKALADGGEDAKLLAGGHSLLPLMKLRLAAPSLLVDLRKVPGLHGIQRENGNWRIGALTVHSELEHNSDLGVVSLAAGTIADPQVRNRGTIGGSLAHGDPASDLPAVMMICEASITLQGAGGQQRSVSANEFFQDYLETAVEPNEVLTEVRIPAYDGWGFGYEKFNRRSEDWAMVGVSALVRKEGDTISDVRVGLTNMGSVPLRARAVEEALRGQSASADSIARAAEQAAEGTNPPADLNASAEYKRHLARVMTRRALETAAGLG
ncbi:MAG TPA: xanthine dehydrogenase family protein subunit M [Solirubrobacteraceae bacterium]|nr:xanthine dehydrogenase family protein subunit M [Solirubrobacteraceae bacterium]